MSLVVSLFSFLKAAFLQQVNNHIEVLSICVVHGRLLLDIFAREQILDLVFVTKCNAYELVSEQHLDYLYLLTSDRGS